MVDTYVYFVNCVNGDFQTKYYPNFVGFTFNNKYGYEFNLITTWNNRILELSKCETMLNFLKK
jgi:hypothetical protein